MSQYAERGEGKYDLHLVTFLIYVYTVHIDDSRRFIFDIALDHRLEQFRDFQQCLQLDEFIVVAHVDKEIRLCELRLPFDVGSQCFQFFFIERTIVADHTIPDVCLYLVTHGFVNSAYL